MWTINFEEFKPIKIYWWSVTGPSKPGIVLQCISITVLYSYNPKLRQITTKIWTKQNKKSFGLCLFFFIFGTQNGGGDKIEIEIDTMNEMH